MPELRSEDERRMKEYIISVQDDERDFEEVFIAYIKEQTELIRCKDCKYRYDGKDDSPCELINLPLDLSKSFYCGLAERKEE